MRVPAVKSINHSMILDRIEYNKLKSVYSEN
jgi:hypothetical protein